MSNIAAALDSILEIGKEIAEANRPMGAPKQTTDDRDLGTCIVGLVLVIREQQRRIEALEQVVAGMNR